MTGRWKWGRLLSSKIFSLVLLPLRTLHKTLHTLRLRRHWQKETARKADNNFSIEKLANFLLADIHFNRKVPHLWEFIGTSNQITTIIVPSIRR
jgi:hypothetical protein